MIVDPQQDAPSFEDVEAAAQRLAGVAIHTPLLRSDAIDDLVGARVWFKPECLQVTGSFKIRGAWNRISQIPDEIASRGVVAYSSGNHAQGVAASARLRGMPATIVMPADAPQSKIESTRALGASIRLYDRAAESREAIGEELVGRTGATLVRPFDDAFIIAGQATATLEAVHDAQRMGIEFAQMFCPASGGGLLAGAATVLSRTSPNCKLRVAEPLGHDDQLRSLEAGAIVQNEPGFRSIADALLAPSPGELTFSINRKHVSGGVAVSDREIFHAMLLAFSCLKLVVEPGGACGLAALIKTARDAPPTGPILVMLSGGNVDPDVFKRALTEGAANASEG